MLFKFVLCLLCVVYPVHNNNLLEDDICTADDTSNGICKHVHNCPSAIAGLKRKTVRPKICSFAGQLPIVCCKNSPIEEPTVSDFGKVSAEMCSKYASTVIQNYSSPTLLPGVLFEIEDTCAIKKENYRESSVLAREFPHLASIGYDYSTGKVWKCSGSLISDQFVLTAANCATLPRLGQAKYARVGSTSVRENFYHEKPLQYFTITKFLTHPNFNEATLANNLALVKLDTKVEFNSIVRPACLSTWQNWTANEAINVGWGSSHRGAFMNNEPLKNLMKTASRSKCLGSGIQPNQFCVEEKREGLWQTCLTDLGSSLLLYDTKNYCAYDIVGVLSSWDNCFENKAGIYTNVTSYIPWMEEIIWSRKSE